MSQIWIIMYFSDAFQIEEISINKNDYELLKFLTVYCMCLCSKRELLSIQRHFFPACFLPQSPPNTFVKSEK